MKKLLSLMAAAAMCCLAFTSCSDDDDDTTNCDCDITTTTVTEGIYVVNEGTYGSILGSLTSIGKDGSVIQDAFAKANDGMSLGDTPNDAIVYGSKLYIAVNGDDLLWVLDRNTLKISEQISTTELMGEDKGKQPRCLVADGQYVYLSTYDGYVAAIDTTTYEATTIYQAGSYPEGMAISNGYLYVANSDYGNGVNPSISQINLNTGEVTDIKDDLIMNPTAIMATDDAIYVLDYGQYDANWNQTDAGVRKIQDGNVEKVVDATLMAIDTQRGLIYTVNAPYSYPSTPVTYGVYDIAAGQASTFITGDEIDSPAAIAVDPESGDIYISSYQMNADTGYADYSANGYLNQYSADGTFVTSYETGVGPTTLVFNYYTTYE